MPMKMGWRWYGEGNDPISLSDIKQIPGVTSIVWALHDKMPGEIWEIDEIQKVADQIHAYGFDMDVVESVNVHDDIKIGLPTRDKYIENYKQCIRNLSKFGVKVICYNFMPVFDWTRTDLFHPVGDGSTALFYEKDKIKGDYKAMAEYIMSFTEKYNMTFPGWEPERMAKLDELFKAYAPVTKEKLWENLKYFLEALMPTCHECGIKMAIHQDDPPWDIFGLPRLLIGPQQQKLPLRREPQRILQLLELRRRPLGIAAHQRRRGLLIRCVGRKAGVAAALPHPAAERLRFIECVPPLLRRGGERRVVEQQPRHLQQERPAAAVAADIAAADGHHLGKGLFREVLRELAVDPADLLAPELRLIADELVERHAEKRRQLRQHRRVRQALPRFP